MEKVDGDVSLKQVLLEGLYTLGFAFAVIWLFKLCNGILDLIAWSILIILSKRGLGNIVDFSLSTKKSQNETKFVDS